jgi:hypothetical protein
MSPEPDQEVFLKHLPDSPATRMRSIEGAGSYAIIILESTTGIICEHYALAGSVVLKVFD